MFIKILYVLLVLCMAALVGAVIAGYLRVRRQMKAEHKAPEGASDKVEELRQ